MERYLARVAFLALKIWNFILFILTRIKYFSRKKRPKDTSVSNPAITDLIEIWPKTIDQQDYAKQIFTLIEKARNTAREKAKAWNKTNIGKGDELPIILVFKRQQRARKSLGAR